MTARVSWADRIPALAAYSLPLAAFLALGSLERSAALAGHYPWFYTLKVGMVMALWWRLRRSYPPPTADGLRLGVTAGIVGAAIWIVLAKLDLEAALRLWLPVWLVGGERIGYDPVAAIASPAGRFAFLAVRLFGLAVVVPLAEEVFWRGFLLRYLVEPDFEKVPIGKFSPGSFAIVTFCFAAVHPELLAAAVWCAGVNALLYRTANLWSCIAAHAVTNLLLGVYIIAFADWSLW